MLKKIFALSLVVLLSGCASGEAQPYGYAMPNCHEEYRSVYDSFYGSRTVTTTVCNSSNYYNDTSNDAGIFLFGTILGAAIGSQYNNDHHHYTEYHSYDNYRRNWNYGRHENFSHMRNWRPRW